MSLPLRYKHGKHDISPFTREVQEVRDLTVYENTGNTIYRFIRERSTRVTRSHSLREKHRKHNMSPFTREVQEVPIVTFYERSTGNTISRPLREKYKKFEDSQFTRTQVTRYLAYKWEVQALRDLTVYEKSKGNTISRRLREKYKRYKLSQFTREAQGTRYLALYERSTRRSRSYILREHRCFVVRPVVRVRMSVCWGRNLM